MSIEIDTCLSDTIEAYFVRVINHANEVMKHKHVISKRQLLRFVETVKHNAEESLDTLRKK